MASGGQQQLNHLWFECNGKFFKVLEDPNHGHKLNLGCLRLDPLTITLNEMAYLVDIEGWTTFNQQDLQSLFGHVGTTRENAIKVEGDPGPGSFAAMQGIIELVSAHDRILRQMRLPYTARLEDMGNIIFSKHPEQLEYVLKEVPALRVGMTDVVDGLNTATGEVFAAAADARDSEEPAQTLFNKLSTDLCALARPIGGGVLHSCDTHQRGFPVNPNGKVDVILSTAPKPAIGQVLWSTVVAVIKLKRDLGLSTSLLNEGYGQLQQRAEAVLSQQPRRSWVLGVLADGRSVEVIRFTRAGVAPGAVGFCRSGPHLFTRDARSSGLALLARVMLASPAELGFVQPTVQGLFSVEKEGRLWQVQPQQVLQEHGTAVYSCTCSLGSPAQGVQAVLKKGHCREEAGMIQRLNSRGIQGIPTCWLSGDLPGGESFLIIQPFGRAVVFGDDFSAERIFQVARDVAVTLAELSNIQVWHMDVSPNNIIVDENGKGLLVDFHMAQEGQGVAGRVTRRNFMPLTRLEKKPVTLSGELESLLYTVLYWFSNGHLPWEQDYGRDEVAAALKLMYMTHSFEDKVLAKCNVPDDAKAVVLKLKELFFNPQYPNCYNSNVAAADFLDVLP